MNKHIYFRRVLCGLLAFMLLGSIVFAAFAVEEKEEMHIRSAEDLFELSHDCRWDAWSRDREIYLDTDISLSGLDFTPIRYFDGTFHGNGHTISGLNLAGNVSPCGLFSEVGTHATVEKLNVQGDILPAGSGDAVGGIAGINSGLIAGCSFTGSVTGKNMVGGIAGQNLSTGSLLDCRTEGSVLGGAMVGGIVGNNSGNVLSAENESYVNIESTDPKLNISDLNITQILKNFNILSSDTAGVVQDSGGIAGYNTGIIGLCTNTATVGYQHTGYNTGGIAGRSSGYLYSCSNSGEIFGRKDVGGIVGQMEPYVFDEIQTDLLANLNGQYQSLTWLLNDAANDASAYGDQAAARYHYIANQFQPVADAFQSADFTDQDSLENLFNSVSGAVSQTSGTLHGLGNDLTAAGITMNSDMSAINEQITAISGATSSLIYTITNPDLSTLFTDTSDQQVDKLTYGKISECENTGNIEADRDVGGIAGQVSVEDSGNPEDDLSLNLGSTLRTEYEYKAVIISCINRGSITARKNNAGSISGMSNLGFITGCQGYGTVVSENGNYVGGIAGLNMAKIEDCWTKCRLSGEKYVGGIIGCGSSEGDTPSLVSHCVSFSQIAGCQQFYGAISGYADGDYSGNRFISDDLQGIDGLNIAGKADPADYAELLEDPTFPEDCRSFTLTFLADGEVIQEIPFDFGSSVPASQFPAVPEKEGYFGQWNIPPRDKLYNDVQVEAEYRRLDTILPSNLTRASNRAALYAEGGFDKDAIFLVSVDSAEPWDAYDQVNTPWFQQIREQLQAHLRGEAVDATVCRALVERLTLSIPDDGADSHVIRYTPPEQLSASGIRIYQDTPEGLIKLPVESIGKYNCFPVSGNKVTLVVFSTVRTGWMLLISFAALLAAAAVIFVLVRLVRKHYLKKFSRKVIQNVEKQAENLSKEKKITLFVSLVLGTACLVAAVVAFRSTPLWASMQTAKEIRSLLKAENRTYSVSVSGNLGSRTYSIEGNFCNIKEKHLTAMTVSGTPVYFTDNRVYLKNGTAYTVSDDLPGWSHIMPLVLDAYRKGEPEKEINGNKNSYRISCSGETANEIAGLILPESTHSSTAWELKEMTFALESEDTQLNCITLSCCGETHSGAPVSLICTFTPSDSVLSVPQAVTDAITRNDEPRGTLTADLLILVESWENFYAGQDVTGTLNTSANCGTLIMSDSLTYAHTMVDSTPIGRLSKNQNTVYFTEDSICDADGKPLPDELAFFSDTSKLIPLLETISLHSTFHSQAIGDMTRFTLQISPEDAAQLSQQVIGTGRKLDLEFTDGTLTITLKAGNIQSIALNCDALLTVVRTQIPANISADLILNQGCKATVIIPEAVKNTLIIPEA